MRVRKVTCGSRSVVLSDQNPVPGPPNRSRQPWAYGTPGIGGSIRTVASVLALCLAAATAAGLLTVIVCASIFADHSRSRAGPSSIAIKYNASARSMIPSGRARMSNLSQLLTL